MKPVLGLITKGIRLHQSTLEYLPSSIDQVLEETTFKNEGNFKIHFMEPVQTDEINMEERHPKTLIISFNSIDFVFICLVIILCRYFSTYIVISNLLLINFYLFWHVFRFFDSDFTPIHFIHWFFPKDVSSQGSSEDCWRISHHTYPTHIQHILHIPHISISNVSTTYPTHIQHIAHIPHISIPNVSHTYVSHQYVSMQCVSIQKVVIRIPPLTTNIPYISSTSYISHTYPFQTYPFQTYPTNTCPLQTYPFKRCASAGIANVSHQYIPPIRIFNTYPTSTDPFNAYPFKKFASAGMALSMSITAYHFIPFIPLLLGGNGNEYKNLAFPSILCKIINWI